jgi:hypothetical protein
MGKNSNWNKPAAAKRKPDDDADELEAGDNGFFGAFGSEAAAPSARQKSRLDAEADECVAKYGSAPVRYQPTDAADLEGARAKAKSLIAARVAFGAKRQKERMPARAVKPNDRKGQGSEEAEHESAHETPVAARTTATTSRRLMHKNIPTVSVDELRQNRHSDRVGQPGRKPKPQPRITARLAKKMVKTGKRLPRR